MSSPNGLVFPGLESSTSTLNTQTSGANSSTSSEASSHSASLYSEDLHDEHLWRDYELLSYQYDALIDNYDHLRNQYDELLEDVRALSRDNQDLGRLIGEALHVARGLREERERMRVDAVARRDVFKGLREQVRRILESCAGMDGREVVRGWLVLVAVCLCALACAR